MTRMKRILQVLLIGLVSTILCEAAHSSDDPNWFGEALAEDQGPPGYDPTLPAVDVNEPTESGVTPEDGLMSINFLKTDIREVLSAIAMEQEGNIAIASDVSGEISVHLYKVNLDEALDAVTVAGGVRYRSEGEVYYVYRPSQENSAGAEEQEMRVFQIKYADVEKVKDILEAVVGSDRIDIHEASRTIIAEDTPENIRKIEKIVNHWDARPRQVMIEAKILEIALTDSMSLGVNWEQLLGDVRIATGGFSRGMQPTTEGVSPVPDEGSGLFGNMIVGAGSSYQFTAAIDALQEETDINTLSTPKIVAVHGKQARVQVGGQQGYRVTTSNLGVTSETIEFIDTGTILDITPYITETGDILMNVKPEIATAQIEEDGIPVVNSTVVSTWLLAKSGDTVFIGGLIQDIKLKKDSNVPVLGKLPGVGLLFGQKTHSIDKTELIVLITPQVVDTELDPLSKESIERLGEAETEVFQTGTDLLPPPEQNR